MAISKRHFETAMDSIISELIIVRSKITNYKLDSRHLRNIDLAIDTVQEIISREKIGKLSEFVDIKNFIGHIIFDINNSSELDFADKSDITALSERIGAEFDYYLSIAAENDRDSVIIFDDISAIPEQANGPRFAMSGGKINLTMEVANQSDPVPARVHSLLPILRDLAINAQSIFGRNQAHPRIYSTISKYIEALEGDAESLDYNVIAAYGVMLSNAEEAGLRQIADRLAPELEDDEKSILSSILDLHGPFVLATDAGQSLLADAATYNRLKGQEDLFRSASIEIAQALQEENIATPKAGSFLLETVENIGEGPHPGRSGALGTNTVRNALVALVAGALVALPASWSYATSVGWISTVLIAEGVKKSELGVKAAEVIRDAIDDPTQKRNLMKIAPFILRHENSLRIIAGSEREFSWLNKWLDWLRDNFGEDS